MNLYNFIIFPVIVSGQFLDDDIVLQEVPITNANNRGELDQLFYRYLYLRTYLRDSVGGEPLNLRKSRGPDQNDKIFDSCGIRQFDTVRYEFNIICHGKMYFYFIKIQILAFPCFDRIFTSTFNISDF